MITIKLKLTETIDVKKYQKQFTSIRNYAFNRFNEGYKQNQIEQQVKTKLNNIDLMDVSFQKEAVNEARIYIKEDQKTVVFGGKKNREKYHKGQITKEEYQKKRLSSIIVRGETGRGNRKFQLDAKNNQVIFKPNKKTKICCKYKKTKRDKTLVKLQQLCELGTTYFTARLNQDYVYITFDETILREKKYKPILKRICAIDLNPNYIAIVVRHGKSILHKEILGLHKLNQCKNTNKKKHEDYEIAKRLTETAKHYQCEYFAYEELNIKSNDKGKGKKFNKLCNNDWRRKLNVKRLTTYKSLYLAIKKSGYSYRNLFDPRSFSFRSKYGKSLVDIHCPPLQVFTCFE